MKLEKIKSISHIIAVIAIPVITLIIGQEYTESVKERDVQGRFVELAIDVLKEKPKKENKNVRDWAIQIVNKYSGVKMNEVTKSDLIEKVPIKTEPRVRSELDKIYQKNTNETDPLTLGKNFIRIAEIFLEQDEIFQATITLNSIIVNKAKALLSKIEKY